MTLVLTALPHLVGVAVSVANNPFADRLHSFSFHIILPLVIAIIGSIFGANALNTPAGYFPMFLMIAEGHGANGVMTALTQKTMLRPRTKRAAAMTFVNACGDLVQVFAAYCYPNQDAPRYVLAMSVNSSFAFLTIVLTTFMRIMLLRANTRLENDSSDNVSEYFGDTATNEVGLPRISEEEALTRRHGFRYIA